MLNSTLKRITLFCCPFVYISLRNIGRGMSRRRKSSVFCKGKSFAPSVKAATRRRSAATAGSTDDVSQGNGKDDPIAALYKKEWCASAFNSVYAFACTSRNPWKKIKRFRTGTADTVMYAMSAS